MTESARKFKGTVTWFDVRTGFCLIRPNGRSAEVFAHRSFIEAAGLRAPTVGETVEVLIVKINYDRPRKLRRTFTVKSYIQRGRQLGPDTRLVKSDEDESTGKLEERNWAMLPREILSIIFKKAGAAVVVASAQFVCKPWQQLSKEPDLWRCVDIRLKDALSISAGMTNDEFNVILLEFIAMVAVDRSDGCLEEFSAEGIGTDVLMDYIADRATRLRCLRLISVYDMSDKAVVEAVKKFPELEEIWISPGLFSFEIVESVGHACPGLKTLTLRSSRGFPHFQSFMRFIAGGDLIDLSAIAKHMHQLRRLEISAGVLSNSSLCFLVNSCPHLEYLDVSGCQINIDENLKTKFASIKEVRLPSANICDARGLLSSIELGCANFDIQ